MNIVVFTLGCKVNQYESGQIMDEFANRGHSVTSKMGVADVYIINTCAVTQEAERKSRQICRRAKTYNESASVFVVGCAVENYQRQTNSAFFAGAIIVGGNDKNQVVERVLSMYKMDCDNTVEKTDTVIKGGKSRKYIKIQDGCNKFCSYCIIPHLRGRSKSKDIDQIIQEMSNSDALEFVLTGIDISSYGLDNKMSLVDLVQRVDTDARIRLGSIDCTVITRQLLQTMKEKNNYCDHFHLSLQSATDSTLKSMNRRYTIQEFIDKVDLIREIFGKNTGITTDIIAGYPTETELDFETTVSNLEKIKFSDMHIFRYSPRVGTTAYNLSTLPSQTVANRVKILENIRDKYKQQFLKRQIGLVHSVFFETYKDGLAKGYTTNYCLVYAKAQTQQINSVIIQSVKDDKLYGEIL